VVWAGEGVGGGGGGGGGAQCGDGGGRGGGGGGGGGGSKLGGIKKGLGLKVRIMLVFNGLDWWVGGYT